ncbi:esterase [Chryseobacterium shigense]|uniref:S-formylglutathione hydrolase FrmB n=1 Tax=Chryseobacterium shigense TaxID=297244 RepID=A0A1N7ILX2_9FLAO|nr:alpha/beta hydrolase family protein [Chryseobacterium shigense]PQA95796.1 esterase [Chryseobacterium shigense]SIS37986.1 S-formylglutathione hydrolase FrmB [Chryseobacterium shigense]
MNKLIGIIIGLVITISLKAQEKWIIKSQYTAQSDTVLIFKPKSYNEKEQLPLVYLLHGYSENYRQWSKTTDLQKLADQYNFIIVTPDGFTSYYINSPTNKKSQYEDFFFKELVPKVHRSFTIDDKNIFISGLSMGGYGALRYFILHPDYFNTAGSTSGALEIDYPNFRKVSQHFWQNNRLIDDLTTHMGDPKTANWNQYSISTLLKQHPNFKKAFIFDCGTEDILYSNSTQLKQQTDGLRIPATFISQPGDHNTEYWNKSIEHHFVYFKQHLKK